jgi:hypothetical protein
MAELTCRELVELVTDYLEGALMPERRASFEKHLVYCPGCVHYLDQMRQTVELTGTLNEHDLSPDAERAFLAAFRSWHAGEASA